MLYQKEIKINLITEHPVALDSKDHTSPLGTANDNTECPDWVLEIEEYFKNKKDSLFYMDLGCSGGGLVSNFYDRNHIALGLEGSDYSLKAQRANWGNVKLKENLLTCDISRPFFLLDQNMKVVKFDAISAFEVFEHIPQNRLHTLYTNILNHLKDDGIFVGTINSAPQDHHVTQCDQQWWTGQLNEYFQVLDWPFRNRVRADGGSFNVLLKKKV